MALCRDPSRTIVRGFATHSPRAGTAILCNMLRQTKGVYPVMARDGWPKNEKIFEGAKAVVFYLDGGGGHPVIQPKHKEAVQKVDRQRPADLNKNLEKGK